MDFLTNFVHLRWIFHAFHVFLRILSSFPLFPSLIAQLRLLLRLLELGARRGSSSSSATLGAAQANWPFNPPRQRQRARICEKTQ